MAVLHRKEEKIQAVLGRLPKKYNPDDFVAMFIKLYSKDWGKIKSAYIKASQDKEPGTVIHMPKPELYLKQVLEIFLAQNTVESAKEEVVEIKPVSVIEKTVKIKKEQSVAIVKTAVAVKKSKAAITEEPVTKVKKSKVVEAEKSVTKAVKSKITKDKPVAVVKVAEAVKKPKALKKID